MQRAAIGSILLVFIGLVTGLVTIGADIRGSGVDQLVTGFLIVSSGGYVATGALWFAQERTGCRYAQLPSITLMVLGLTAIIGGFVWFDPLQPSITQGGGPANDRCAIPSASSPVASCWDWRMSPISGSMSSIPGP